MFSKLFKKITANIPAYLDEQYSDDPIYPGYTVENSGCYYHVLATFPSRTGMKLVCVSKYNVKVDNAYFVMNASAARVSHTTLYGVGGLVRGPVRDGNAKEHWHPMVITGAELCEDFSHVNPVIGRVTALSLIDGISQLYAEESFDKLEAIQDPFIIQTHPVGSSLNIVGDIPATGSTLLRVVKVVKNFWGLDGKEHVVFLDSVHPESPEKDGYTIVRADKL